IAGRGAWATVGGAPTCSRLHRSGRRSGAGRRRDRGPPRRVCRRRRRAATGGGDCGETVSSGVDKPELVERRLKYIARQIQLDKSDVNVKFQGQSPQGTGSPNRDGMPKLPVGQHEVKNWPVLDLGETPDIPVAEWKLEVGGLVENPFTLTWDRFLALPQGEDVSDFHCVTTWSRYDNRWRGVRFKTIAELAIPNELARFVLCTGYDFMPGSYIPYTTNLPLARAVEDDVLLVHTWQGQPLPREHGGPCRM